MKALRFAASVLIIAAILALYRTLRAAQRRHEP
jgi:hypothetical protein